MSEAKDKGQLADLKEGNAEKLERVEAEASIARQEVKGDVEKYWLKEATKNRRAKRGKAPFGR